MDPITPSFISQSAASLSDRLRNMRLASCKPPHSFSSSPPESFSYQAITPPPPLSVFPKQEAPTLDFDLDWFDDNQAYKTADAAAPSDLEMFMLFKQTRSRVVRLHDLPASSSATRFLLARLFDPHRAAQSTQAAAADPQGVHSHSHSVAVPSSLWTLKEEFGGQRAGEERFVWAVFRNHEEACGALRLSGSTVSISTALEADLEPYLRLRRFEMSVIPPSSGAIQSCATMHLAGTLPGAPTRAGPSLHISVPPRYELSSNPPNAKAVFRPGDWICASPFCAAHNFGRNHACIGCSAPRPYAAPPSPSTRLPMSPTARLASPRFASHSAPSPTQPAFPPSPLEQLLAASHTAGTKASQSTHHLLTPSGRTLAIGGRVQNVSSDPLSPCIIFWPDNEPFPEPGQIRPAILAQIPQPPILNTGNKGPIEHQPGDWICQKCDYLNWRRRKVCQTCFPYAEGNGDSVSPAAHAERIALLSNLFAQAQISPEPRPTPPARPPLPARSSSATIAPRLQTPFSADDLRTRQGSTSIARQNAPIAPTIHPKRSFPTTTDFPSGNIVYQTPSHPLPSARYATTAMAPNALLPSFLKQQVRAPGTRSPVSLSPTSTSSADLSFDEYDDVPPSPASFGHSRGFYTRPLSGSGSGGLSNASGSTSSLTQNSTTGNNIWAMGNGENKPWNAIALPSPDFLAGPRRTASGELLRGAGL